MISPPGDDEIFTYVTKPKSVMVWVGLLSFVPLLIGMILFLTHTLMATWFYVPFFLLTVIYLGVSYFVGVFSDNWDREKYRRCRWLLDDYLKYNAPHVDVFLPVCGEDTQIILNAWHHTSKIDWPNINVYVLDDSPTDKLREAAESFGFHYLRRPNLGENKKAGNLKHGFFRTHGEFILILDADFCPRHDILHHMMPVAINHPKTAIVQTPQYFDVSWWMNWVERGAGYVQELFYRVIQVSRNHYKGSICVGSCALYRRSAMVEIGGPVQIEHSEDVWTGFRLTDAGYHVEYLPLLLSKGRCPDSLKAYFNQQYRWCSGSLSLGTTLRFWESTLTVMQKICYSSGFLYYITTALSVFLIHAPGLFMLWLMPEHIFLINMLFYAPSFAFGTAFIIAWSIYKPDINYLYLRQVSYYAHLLALVDRLRGKIQGWIPTGQKGARSRYDKARTLALAWNGVVLFSLIGGVINASQYTSLINLIPPLVFGLINTGVCVRAFTKEQV
jgi:cellulose synthase/poly-beta-1,6-N-acetylglucosamine synthase-like glycosyltransferase